jgi:predicted nucleic acid-binding protein
MIYALDSNIISFLLRPTKNPEVVKRFNEILEEGHDYVIPPFCYYEVYWLLLKKNATVQIRSFKDIYAGSLTKINMTEAEFNKAVEIRAMLEERGTLIGKEGNQDADIFIAAHCIINGYTLVTDNTNDFKRIGSGLKMVNWKKLLHH